MRRTVNIPVIAIAALAIVFVLAVMAALSPGLTRPGGPTSRGGLIDRVLPGGTPLFERAPAPPHAR